MNKLSVFENDGGAEPGPDLPTMWPSGIAHDGTNFWITQSDHAHGAGFALWRWNPETGLTNRITCDLPLASPAWHKGRLWFLAEGEAYEINPGMALRSGKVESDIFRRFNTPGVALASDGTNLWGMGRAWTLHRLYLP